MNEEWKDVIGFEDYYQVSDKGRILSKRTMKIRAKSIQKNGYDTVTFWVNGSCKTKTVHSVVAEAFIGPRPEGLDIDHIDNVRCNNCIENLRYISRSENVKKSFNGKRKGVSKMRKQKSTPQRWRADIWLNGKRHYIGSWDDKNKAHDAYKIKHIDIFGYEP